MPYKTSAYEWMRASITPFASPTWRSNRDSAPLWILFRTKINNKNDARIPTPNTTHGSTVLELKRSATVVVAVPIQSREGLHLSASAISCSAARRSAEHSEHERAQEQSHS